MIRYHCVNLIHSLCHDYPIQQSTLHTRIHLLLGANARARMSARTPTNRHTIAYVRKSCVNMVGTRSKQSNLRPFDPLLHRNYETRYTVGRKNTFKTEFTRFTDIHEPWRTYARAHALALARVETCINIARRFFSEFAITRSSFRRIFRR